MDRRKFITGTLLSAVAISTSGFVLFDGKNYIGDCETTSDILGPFYRPGSPVRNNLIIEGEGGTPLELMGTILHNNCSTPYKNAKIELWHCDNKGVYDNDTPDFRYRGTTYSDKQGNYSIKTIIPVPYEVSKGNYRPAHFHIMITADGYQPLVTQLYFSGDKYISGDSSASNMTAKRRILDVQNKNGISKVVYNVGMAATLIAEPESMSKLTGSYTNQSDDKDKLEFFIQDHQLWMKNGIYGENFSYKGNNTFEYSGAPSGAETTLHFDLTSPDVVKLNLRYYEQNEIKNVVYQKN